MLNWFKRKKTVSEKIKELENRRRLNGEYTFGNFTGTADTLELSSNQITFFPEPKHVFPKDDLGELMPICVFDLKLVFDDLSGVASFVHVFREYGEYPSENWYNDFCTDYVLGFEQEKSGGLKLLGSKELFGCSESYIRYKQKSKLSFREARKAFHTNGLKYFGEEYKSSNIIRQLGSKPFWVQADETPQIEGIRFIGQMDSGTLFPESPYLFLFIDPANNRLYQVEQFS